MRSLKSHVKLCAVGMRNAILGNNPISFPEAAILLVSDGGTRPLARSNSGSPRFTDFPSPCACSGSSLTNLIGSGLNLLCLHSHSKPECRWAWPRVPIFPAHDKRDPWGRGWGITLNWWHYMHVICDTTLSPRIQPPLIRSRYYVRKAKKDVCDSLP